MNKICPKFCWGVYIHCATHVFLLSGNVMFHDPSVSRMHTFRLLCCLNRISWCLFSAKRACQTRYSEPDHFILQIKWENIIRQTVQVCIAAPQHQTKFVKVICFLQRQKQSLNKNNNAVWYLVSRLLTAQGKHTLIVLKLKTDVARYFLHLHYSLLALL